MSKKRALAHFRQLCSLGLPRESLGPALLEALHHVVPSLHNRIVWCDERRNLTALYCEHPDMYVYGKLFFENYDNRLPDFPGTDFVLSREPGAGHYLRYVTTREYFDGEYHNEIERPCGGHHFMDMAIADAHGNLGAILLTREPRAKAYNSDEIETLNTLIPHIAHAMRCAPNRIPEAGTRRDNALLIGDREGNLQFATATGRQLMSMAFCPDVRQGEIGDRLKSELPAPVKLLCRALRNLQAGRPAPAPSFSVDTSWGRFRFSAMMLRDQNGDATDQVAVNIEYHEPRVTTLMRTMWSLGLSAAQKQVCLLLVDGNATEIAIAGKLGVSPSTVHDHLVKVYRKLGVHSREELIRVLSGERADERVG